MKERHPCVCCGAHTLREPGGGSDAICPLCGWQDDAVQNADPHETAGPNDQTLSEARRALHGEL